MDEGMNESANQHGDNTRLQCCRKLYDIIVREREKEKAKEKERE
jgi:CRISPR/Cas system CSM-associated protein Csm2 small subunit